MKYKLTVRDTDCCVTYEFEKAEDVIKQLESIKKAEEKEKEVESPHTRPLTPFERCRNQVYATGNKWAIENFNATHY